MVENKYETSADVWGMGVVFSEVIFSSKVYIDMGVDPNKGFIFPGDSCFPLTPDSKLEQGHVSN